MSPEPESYLAVHRYDSAALKRDCRDTVVPCVITQRDMSALHDIWRYKFLTAPQLYELWWPGRTERPGQRRLKALFHAGYVDRFRPITRTGSFPWTYQLTAAGHQLLQRAGVIKRGERFMRRTVHDYGYILHEIQLNAWVLAYRRLLSAALISWAGEVHIEPPGEVRRAQLRLNGDWSAEELQDPRPRPVRPDAVLRIRRHDAAQTTSTFLIEYDRTRRVDKNYDKFRRYDTFLTWWWSYTNFGDYRDPPFVVFVCQDREQLAAFLTAADRELTGTRWHPSNTGRPGDYVGRRRLLFVEERDIHAGQLDAVRVPELPRRCQARTAELGRVCLPSCV